MSTVKLEDRVAALEADVAHLKGKLEQPANSAVPWWERIAGAFENDPAFQEAMRLGRAYRESLRPKPRKRRRRKNGHSRHGPR